MAFFIKTGTEEFVPSIELTSSMKIPASTLSETLIMAFEDTAKPVFEVTFMTNSVESLFCALPKEDTTTFILLVWFGNKLKLVVFSEREYEKELLFVKLRVKE